MRECGTKNEKPTDDELVSLVKKGDASAFVILSDRYMPALYNRASRYANVVGIDLEDFVQEGLLALFRAAKGFDPGLDARFGTFAITCINNSMSDSIKAFMRNARQHSHLNIDDLDENNLSSRTSPVEDSFLDQEASTLRAQRIENLLSVFEQQVLKHYLGGHSYQQISAILGTDTKAVDNALQRVRRKLRPEG